MKLHICDLLFFFYRFTSSVGTNGLGVSTDNIGNSEYVERGTNTSFLLVSSWDLLTSHEKKRHKDNTRIL